MLVLSNLQQNWWDICKKDISNIQLEEEDWTLVKRRSSRHIKAWLNNIDPWQARSSKYILLPMNREKHWQLLALDVEHKSFLHLNSQRNPVRKDIANKLVSLFCILD